MLKLDKFQGAIVSNKPYLHVTINGLISQSDICNLVNNLPIENEKITTRDWGSDKTYKVRNSMLYDLQTGMQNNPRCWETLINSLKSKEYIHEVSRILGPGVLAADIEVIFKRYFPGDYISPHTDRDFVFGTHLFFFNQTWEHAWGGLLQILDQDKRVVSEIPPLADISFMFAQSNQSWHAVSTIEPAAVPRLCLQVTFWRHHNKIRTPGRIEVNTQ